MSLPDLRCVGTSHFVMKNGAMADPIEHFHNGGPT